MSNDFDDFQPPSDEPDFGNGAGFYVDATQAPWAQNFRMDSYVTRELPATVPMQSLLQLQAKTEAPLIKRFSYVV